MGGGRVPLPNIEIIISKKEEEEEWKLRRVEEEEGKKTRPADLMTRSLPSHLCHPVRDDVKGSGNRIDPYSSPPVVSLFLLHARTRTKKNEEKKRECAAVVAGMTSSSWTMSSSIQEEGYTAQELFEERIERGKKKNLQAAKSWSCSNSAGESFSQR